MPGKLRWGILGTGAIARLLAQGIATSANGELLAVASRSQATADRFGDEFGVARRYASYEALLADPDVQVVYIALPNHLHAEWAIRAAQAGKHILCEKPLTATYAEAERVVAAARERGVFLMEAFLYRHHPQTARLKAIIASGVIGDVRLIEASFSFALGPDYTPENNTRLMLSAAGGGIMDVGCYPVSLARLVVGEESAQVTGVAQIGPASQVDEWAIASLRFPSGALASLTCGIGLHVDQSAHIWGTRGSIHLTNPWFPAASALDATRLIVRAGGEQSTIIEEVVYPSQAPTQLFALEVDAVAAHLADRQSPAMPWADSLGNMATLDAWRHAVGMRFAGE
ncbi:MAG TPA: Gfo/Idh/MocA family oxidoreductase [Ktedonobacterales bacterium]|nr:Gfo/Idh/MocA family oxidoreductase [Ktedonobacterales bacterium]